MDKILWKKIDFTKIGFAINPKICYEASNTGLIRYSAKNNNKYRYIGQYGVGKVKKKSRFKFKSYEIQIKHAILSAFNDKFDIKKYDVYYKDNNVANCNLDNLEMKLKPMFSYIEPKNETLELYNLYLENGKLYKIANFSIRKYNFLPTAFFDYEDAIQDLIFYTYHELFRYDLKDYYNFDSFLFLKMYDRIRRIISNKSKHTNLLIEGIIGSFKSSDNSILLEDVLY